MISDDLNDIYIEWKAQQNTKSEKQVMLSLIGKTEQAVIGVITQ